MRFKTLGLIVALALLAYAAPALAQAPAGQNIDRLRFVASGGVAPVTNDLPLTAVTGPFACTAPTAGVVHNPANFEYKVNNTDTQCFRYTDPGNGPLIGLPIGNAQYTSTIQYLTTSGLVGPLSNVSNPFDRPGVAPTTAPAVLRVNP